MGMTGLPSGFFFLIIFIVILAASAIKILREYERGLSSDWEGLSEQRVQGLFSSSLALISC